MGALPVRNLPALSASSVVVPRASLQDLEHIKSPTLRRPREPVTEPRPRCGASVHTFPRFEGVLPPDLDSPPETPKSLLPSLPGGR